MNTTIPPTPPPSLPAAPALLPVSASILDPPSEIVLLPPGTEVIVRVIDAGDVQRAFALGPKGPLLLRLPAPFPPGTALTLTLTEPAAGASGSRATPMPARIAAVNGEKPVFLPVAPSPGEKKTSPETARPLPPQAALNLPTDTLSVGTRTFRGTIVAPAEPPSSDGASFPAGTSFFFRLTAPPAASILSPHTTDDVPPAPLPSPSPAAPDTPSLASPPPSASPSSPGRENGDALPLQGKSPPFPEPPPPKSPSIGVAASAEKSPQSQPPSLFPTASSPTASSPTASSPTASSMEKLPFAAPLRESPGIPSIPPLLKGEILPTPPSFPSLVKTDLGILALDKRLALPASDHPPRPLWLTPMGKPILPPFPSPLPTAPSLLAGSESVEPPIWAVFNEALAVLAERTPKAAAALMQALPGPTPHFAANVLMFLQAAQSGSLRQWRDVAQALEALETGEDDSTELLQRLTRDFETAASRPRVVGDWRVQSLPFLLNGYVESIAVITRRRPNDGEEGGKKKGRNEGGSQRFVIDLSLSCLGPLQLDGLYKQKKRRFDLTIRTRINLPSPMRRDLLVMFSASLEALALAGTLRFAPSDAFPVPCAALPNPRSGTSIMV